MSTSPAIYEIVELLSKKWVMRIIWELRVHPLTFRELQSACEQVSPTVLNNRLKLLKDSQLVEADPERGYRLTELGHSLLEVYKPLGQWAETWRAQRSRSRL